MRKLLNTFSELKPNIFQLIALNQKGDYANINLNTGMILYSKRQDNWLPAQNKISIPEFEECMANNPKLWLCKEFIVFRNTHVEVYNDYVDRVNKMEIIFKD